MVSPISNEAAHDCQLLAAVAQGDQKAFADLYDRFSTMLWAVAIRILQDPAEAEDVVQETFVYVWSHAHRYNPDLSQPSTWMCLILRNRCVDRLRARSRRERLLTAVTDSDSTTKTARPDAATSEVELRELSDMARKALSGISGTQRQALELAYFAGQSHSQIASTLRLPLGTVKTLIRQGLIFLRSRLGELWS